MFMFPVECMLTELGAVWPGVTAFPDWFHPNISDYWNNEFAEFFDTDKGVDIDALWIDMNDASNMCTWPCEDAFRWAEEKGYPPAPPPMRSNPRPLPGFPPSFQPAKSKRDQGKGQKLGLPNRDYINPTYQIKNEAGSLSNQTLWTDLVHANGVVEYDTHNLYGASEFFPSNSNVLEVCHWHSLTKTQ